MHDRGNTKAFTNGFTHETQLAYFEEHEKDTQPAFKIILDSGEHLEDMLAVL